MKRTQVVLYVLCALALACSSGHKKLDLGGSCSLNSDCADGLLCKFGACHKACVKSIDCATGERCVQVEGVAVCQLVSEGSCDQYGNCQSPFSCRTVDNTCRNKCPTGNECLPGQVCSATFCIESTEVGANPDASVPSPDAMPAPDTATAITPDTATDRPQLSDVSAAPDVGKPGETGSLLTCVDRDGDGYGEGPGCRGPDSDDTNTNVWSPGATCVDSDNDGYFVGCDRYSTVKGPDCDDTGPFCTDSCADSDKNGTADCAEYWSGQGAGGLGFVSNDGNLLFVDAVTGQGGYGGSDIQLVKVSPSGRVLWRKLYGTQNDERMFAASQAADGSIFLSGGTGPGNILTPMYVHLSQEGTVLASKKVPTAGMAYNMHGIVAKNGNVLVDGYDGTNPWIGELSGDLLTFNWVDRIGGASEYWIGSVIVLADGDLMATVVHGSGSGSHLVRLGPHGEGRWSRGVSGSTKLALSPDDGNVVMTAFAVGKAFSVTKMTPDGNVLWSQATSTVGSGDNWVELAVAADGSIFASATNSYPSSSQYSWLARLKSSGQTDWFRRTGGSQVLTSLLPLAGTNGSSVVAGGLGSITRMGSNNPDTSCLMARDTETLKETTPSFSTSAITHTSATPWKIEDYPLSTMPASLSWKQICPARP